MNHLIILPVILPALLGPFILMVLRHHISLMRIFSIGGTVALTGICVALLAQAASGSVQVYELGNWVAPFGIVLVLDRLSALMITLTAVLALVVLLHVVGTGKDARGQLFHALYQFQLMGIMGAFLTGDAFNLFVFFEVLLIASYGLMIHGGGGQRFRAGLQYVVYNLLGSTIFLFALATIYGVTGTLNMADLAQKVAQMPPEDTALLRVGAVLLLLVFAIKSAVLPLHFWLPATYANAPFAVAALFAIMTKVGAYSILRVFTLVFGPDIAATAGLAGDWLLPAALATLAVGSAGILAARELGRLAAFAVIASVGTLLSAVALFSPQAAAAAIYYAIHSTLAGALLFLVADLVRARRSSAIEVAPPMPQGGGIAALFFLAAIAAAGMPPLSGFAGKLLILEATRQHDGAVAIWAVILVASLIAVIGLARAGSILFWKPHDPSFRFTGSEPRRESEDPSLAAGRAPALPFVATAALAAGIIALTIFAGPAMDYATATAEQLFDPSITIDAVMRRP